MSQHTFARRHLLIVAVLAPAAAGCRRRINPPRTNPRPNRPGAPDRPDLPEPGGADGAPDPPARLAVSPTTVAVGATYTATATQFWPGEAIQFSWTGPSSGVIGSATAGSDGQASTLVREGAAPGSYTIYATGWNSGRTASAPLRVVRANT
jgi:hypothetical protein